eukprot:COSAG02_NODE_27985_length_598_cov_3.358717_1_plen_36_part_01
MLHVQVENGRARRVECASVGEKIELAVHLTANNQAA